MPRTINEPLPSLLEIASSSQSLARPDLRPAFLLQSLFQHFANLVLLDIDMQVEQTVILEVEAESLESLGP